VAALVPLLLAPLPVAATCVEAAELAASACASDCWSALMSWAIWLALAVLVVAVALLPLAADVLAGAAPQLLAFKPFAVADPDDSVATRSVNRLLLVALAALVPDRRLLVAVLTALGCTFSAASWLAHNVVLLIIELQAPFKSTAIPTAARQAFRLPPGNPLPARTCRIAGLPASRWVAFMTHPVERITLWLRAAQSLGRWWRLP